MWAKEKLVEILILETQASSLRASFTFQFFLVDALYMRGAMSLGFRSYLCWTAGHCPLTSSLYSPFCNGYTCAGPLEKELLLPDVVKKEHCCCCCCCFLPAGAAAASCLCWNRGRRAEHGQLQQGGGGGAAWRWRMANLLLAAVL